MARPEQRRQRGQDVDEVADSSVNALADERVEGSPHGQGQSPVVGKIGQRQRHEPVQSPGVEPPVKEGDAHRQLGRFGRFRRAPGRAGEVIDRLGDAPEHETDAHAGAEQHGQPAPVAEIGAGVVASQPDLAVAAEQQKQHDSEVDINRQNEEPADVGRDQPKDAVEQRRHLAEVGETESDEYDGQAGREPEDSRVDLEAGFV